MPEAPVSNSEIRRFGTDPGFEFGPGVTAGPNGHCGIYQREGRAYLVGNFAVDPATGSDVIEGNVPALKFPAEFYPADGPGGAEFHAPSTVIARQYETDEPALVFVMGAAVGEAMRGLWIGGQPPSIRSVKWAFLVHGYSYVLAP